MAKSLAPLHYYSSKEIKFLAKTIKGRSYEETRELFNEHFGLELTLSQISGVLKTRRLHVRRRGYCGPNRKGMAQPPQLRGNGFKPGNALNSRPVGTEITSCRGYAMVKIDNQPHDNKKNWKPKHSVIWENAHGAIPKGSVVIFADGDKSNFALDNLLLISRGELAVMSHCGLFSPDRELTKAGKLIADIKIQIARREREGAPRPGEECNVG